MVYTKRTPWTLIMGVIMVAYAYLVQSGALAGLLLRRERLDFFLQRVDPPERGVCLSTIT